MLHDRLKDETYLEQGEATINGYIEKIMINDFEYRLKRSFDISLAVGYKQFDIPGLRDNRAKKFKGGSIYINK